MFPADISWFEKIYVICSIFISIESFILGIFVFLRNRKGILNREYFWLGTSMGLWSLFLAKTYLTVNRFDSLLYCRFSHLFSILTVVCFCRFTYYLLSLNEKYKLFLNGCYWTASFLFVFLFSPLFIHSVSRVFEFHLWPNPGILYSVYVLFFTAFSFFALALIHRAYHHSAGLRRQQLKLIFIGMFLPFMGSLTNFTYAYHIPIAPIGHYFVPVYVFCLAYAIVRYRFLDVTQFVFKFGILASVYVLVLGIPLAVGVYLLGIGKWLIPVFLMAVFATIGPMAYLAFQRKMDKKFLSEQYRYQQTLRNSSMRIGRIKDLNRLLILTVGMVHRAVKVEHCEVYLWHEEAQKYVLKASKKSIQLDNLSPVIEMDSSLIRHIKEKKEPVYYEDLFQRNTFVFDKNLPLILRMMQRIYADLIVPCFIEDKLIALIVLGKKKDGTLFSNDDLVVFSILANQVGLGIENAQFSEKTQLIQEQLFKAEKMATVGMLADGLSHQIRNRLHVMGFIAGDALYNIKDKKLLSDNKENDEFLNDLEYSLKRIEDNVKHGGEIVGSLLRYSRKDTEGFRSFPLSELIDATLGMLQFKMNAKSVQIIKKYDVSLQLLNGHFIQLQEALFNIIDNAFDAIEERRQLSKGQLFSGRIEIEAYESNNRLNIFIRDNGMGVKEENMGSLFKPFFTTKTTSKKGTGLGLYVIRKIIEDNHKGRIVFMSKYSAGTEIKIELPLLVFINPLPTTKTPIIN